MSDRGPKPDARRPVPGPPLAQVAVPDIFEGANDDPPPFRERRSRKDRRARRGRDTPMTIAGVGAVTGYGWGRKQIWDGFRVGESAVRLATGFGEFIKGGSAYAAVIRSSDDEPDGPSRYTRALRFAAREAIADARERGWQPGPVVGLVHSMVLGDVEMWRDFYRFEGKRTSPRRWVQLMPSTVITTVMKENGFNGPVLSVSAMCSSGNAGLLTAKSWLDNNIATDVLLLATDVSGIVENFRWFSDLGVAVLDRPPLDACRPFQEGSRGFVGGEAAVAMVLSADAAGAYGRVLGGAMTHDAFHPITIAPDLIQVRNAFTLALENAGVDAGEVGYVNAHGPGTAQCDAAEAQILDELFPKAHGIYSMKPFTGHCQAAAGAVELLATLFSYETGVIPAPPRVAPGHPRLVDGSTERKRGLEVKSSIGMGGLNAVVVVDAPGAITP
jgi:3-oxoacyl-[acyl-carrier-protein] synthase II